MPLRTVAGRDVSAVSGSNAASADTAVRSTSMGCAVLMPAMMSSTGAGSWRALLSSAVKRSNCACVGSSPYSSKYVVSSKVEFLARSWME
jgi:hypothetical protein